MTKLAAKNWKENFERLAKFPPKVEPLDYASSDFWEELYQTFKARMEAEREQS